MHRHGNMEHTDESQEEEGWERLSKYLICILEAECMDSCTGGVLWLSSGDWAKTGCLTSPEGFWIVREYRPGQGTLLVHESVHWASSIG